MTIADFFTGEKTKTKKNTILQLKIQLVIKTKFQN